MFIELNDEYIYDPPLSDYSNDIDSDVIDDIILEKNVEFEIEGMSAVEEEDACSGEDEGTGHAKTDKRPPILSRVSQDTRIDISIAMLLVSFVAFCLINKEQSTNGIDNEPAPLNEFAWRSQAFLNSLMEDVFEF